MATHTMWSPNLIRSNGKNMIEFSPVFMTWKKITDS